MVVTAYGANDQVLESHTISVSTGWDSYNAGVFAGIVRGEGDILALSFTGAGVVVDDLRVSAVPEPGTLGTVVAGLAVVGAAVRQRVRRAAR